MVLNFFKIAFRNLLKNKGFSTINILGLSIGMASAILIFLWIFHELGFEQFHQKKDRIYEVFNKANFSGSLNVWNTTPKVLARSAEKDVPEVEMAVRVNYPTSLLMTVGEKKLKVSGYMVDSNFLQVFSFPLQKGDGTKALLPLNGLVITAKLAKKLFGEEDAMGKEVKIDNKQLFTVTGILQDIPTNSRFDFEYLLSWSYLRQFGQDDDNWDNNSTQTYILLKPNVQLANANNHFRFIKTKYSKEAGDWEMFLYPLKKWRLHSSFTNGKEDGKGRIALITMFFTVAVFILLIACINFMNLSTARSEKRAKEVGIRKVVGARKSGLVLQFMGESLLIAGIAAIIALLLVQLTLPSFNAIIKIQLFVDYANPTFWAAALGFVVVTGLLAGSYPAFFLSSFQPIKVLKGGFKKSGRLFTPRKILVVVQFTFSIVLIICTIIVKQQIDYAQSRQIGYNKDNLVYHLITGDLEKNYELLKKELLACGAAIAVTKTSSPITQSWSNGWGQEWEGKDPEDNTSFFRYNQDEGLGKTAGLQFIQGRDLDLANYPTDSSAMLINESALKVMKFKDPIGKIVKDNGRAWHIVGVIKDFILTSPYEPTQPMLIYGAHSWFETILIKFNPNFKTVDNLAKAAIVFKKYNPNYPFEYKFVDEEYARKFDDAQRTGTLAALFAALTIFITCLGLYGLATYMAENRIKEIGVRKVLGATVASIVFFLSKEFMWLVCISFLIAAPMAWYTMHQWLASYNYAVPIYWWVFAGAAILSLCIALVSVGYQALKAATANPIKSLRTE